MPRLPALVVCGVALLGALRLAAQQPLILSQLTWFDRTGTVLETVGPLADHGNVELSPDGRRIAVAVTDRATGTHDIWIYPSGGQPTRFTDDAADENWMIFSPDGTRVALNSFTTRRLALLQAPANDAARATPLLDDPVGKWPVSWSPDGRNILYVTSGTRTGNDIWVLPLSGDQQPYPFAATEASENWATFSPDGHFVAFSSTGETGSAEVYVAPFPRTNARVWRVSTDGGTQARWRRPGEILYLAPDRTLMSATVKTTDRDVTVMGVEPLFELEYPYGAYHAFDVTADGQRLIVNRTVLASGGRGLQARGGGRE
jgi:dipeptidyl aminopeptidase/acylaminoacyl peptidase